MSSSNRLYSNEELNLLLEDIKPLESKDFKSIESNSFTTINKTPLIYLDSLEVIICRKCRIFIYPTLGSTLKYLKVSIYL